MVVAALGVTLISFVLSHAVPADPIVSNLGQVASQFDLALTWLVLFAGADRVREFLQGGGDSGGASEKSEVPGFRIVMDDGAEIREIHRAS